MIHDTYYISPLYCISKLHVSFDWFRLRICTFVSNTFNEDCCAKFLWHEKPISKAKNKNIYIIIRENRRYMLDCHDRSTTRQNIVEKKLLITFCFTCLLRTSSKLKTLVNMWKDLKLNFYIRIFCPWLKDSYFDRFDKQTNLFIWNANDPNHASRYKQMTIDQVFNGR